MPSPSAFGSRHCRPFLPRARKRKIFFPPTPGFGASSTTRACQPGANHPNAALYREPEETILDDALTEVEQTVESTLREELDAEAMSCLARLRSPVDAFFDRVTVNVEAEELRANRLRLLARVRRTMERAAAFGELEGR